MDPKTEQHNDEMHEASHEAKKWRSIADQLAKTLLKNGVGGKDFQFALDRYEEAGGNLGAT